MFRRTIVALIAAAAGLALGAPVASAAVVTKDFTSGAYKRMVISDEAVPGKIRITATPTNDSFNADGSMMAMGLWYFDTNANGVSDFALAAQEMEGAPDPGNPDAEPFSLAIASGGYVRDSTAGCQSAGWVPAAFEQVTDVEAQRVNGYDIQVDIPVRHVGAEFDLLPLDYRALPEYCWYGEENDYSAGGGLRATFKDSIHFPTKVTQPQGPTDTPTPTATPTPTPTPTTETPTETPDATPVTTSTSTPLIPPTTERPKAQPGRAPIKLTQRAVKRIVKAGQVATFKITARNTGTAAATGVVVCDRLPKGTQLAGASVKYSFKNTRVCFAIASIAAGKSKTITVKLRVDRTATNGHQLKNTVTATALGAGAVKAAATVKVPAAAAPKGKGAFAG